MKKVPAFKKIRRRLLWHRLLFLPVSALCVPPVLVLAAFVFAKNLLCIESGPRHAEVIVVLGGESVDRANQAWELFRNGAAPGIIVSGDGDDHAIVQYLLAAGVPPQAIELESRSRNTKENAEFTVQMLNREGVHRAIIVTSWFHSRRALNSFCFFAPGIRFSSLPTLKHQGWPAETTHIYQEYLKTVWYYFRYGISPWQAAGSVSRREAEFVPQQIPSKTRT